MKKFYALLLFQFIAVSVFSQVTVNLTPIDDNTLYESGTGALSNGAGDDFFSGNNGSGLHRRGLIKFDIAAAIPAGSTITSVSLQLTMNQSQPGANPVALHTVLTNWGEGTSFAGSGGGGGAASSTNDATWLHTFFSSSFWTNPGGDFNPTASASTLVGTVGNYTWSNAQMVTEVQNWLDNPSTAFGWLLLGNEATNSTSARFVSKESASTTQRPKLTVTYTPPCVNPTVPTVIASQTTICSGASVNLTTTGTLNSATTWELYSGTCASAVIAQNATGSFTVSPTTTTTYFVRGMGGCISSGACGSVTITVNPAENASFGYMGAAYCNNTLNETPVVTGTSGGTFSSAPAGLDLNTTTGEINFMNSSPGFYTVTYQTPGTCSASQNESVAIFGTYNVNTSATICNGEVFMLGTQALTTAGTHSQMLSSTMGCDSAVTVVLTVTTVDTTVSQSLFTLTSAVSSATSYQWLDCDNNFAIIAGETNQSYSPAFDGNYALALTDNGCTDTSGCHEITGIGIHESANDFNFTLYPNPANNNVKISVNGIMHNSKLEIYTMQGKLMLNQRLTNRVSEISIADFSPGIYFIKLDTGEMSDMQKLVIE